MKVGIEIIDRATPKIRLDAEKKVGVLASRLKAASDFLLQKIQENCEPSPNYSLKQLRRMGHPYAICHYEKGTGSWQPKAGTPAENIHDPWWQVNRQSGQLRRALSASSVSSVVPGTLEVRVGVPKDTEAYEYARFVIYGTSKMVPRNFIMNTTFENLEALRSLICRR